MSDWKKILVVANSKQATSKYSDLLRKEYDVLGVHDISSNRVPELVVVIGGDGTMLHAIHEYMYLKVPFYGINTGNLGFLMNRFTKNVSSKILKEKIGTAKKISLNPLEMNATDVNGKKHKALAINEVSLLRETHQTSKISIEVNGETHLQNLIGDGLIVSTPAGSTAYNYSAGGAIIPITANLLALTPINPFRPRRWHGALLHNDVIISIQVSDPKNRAVSATADYLEVRNIKEIRLQASTDDVVLLFNADCDFEYKILKEQFTSRE